MLLEKSAAVQAICAERWHGKGPTPRVDPCGGCPLYSPCINEGCVVPGAEAFNKWITGVNAARDLLSSTRGQGK